LKAANKAAREEIRDKQAEIDATVVEIEQSIYADRPNYESGVMETIRTDTGEITKTRSLTARERQTYLAGEDPDVPMPPPKAPDDIERELDREYGEE
jgi:hypothetical protein